MRHIEILGIPAAGKTTLVERLLQGTIPADHVVDAPLTRAPVTPKQKLAKRYRDLISVTLQLLGNPVRAYRIWRACSVFRQPSASLRIRMYLSCLRVDWLARRGNGNADDGRVVILDQGIYQAVWSLALRADIDPGDDRFLQCCRQLIACLAVPGLVILLDTPVDVARRRLDSEPDAHGRLPKLLEADAGWMRRTQQIVETLWSLACSEPRVATLRYVPDEDTLTDIENAIRELSHAPPEL